MNHTPAPAIIAVASVAVILSLSYLPATADQPDEQTLQVKQATPISGTVIDVKGSRLTIRANDGSSYSITTRQAHPEELLNRTVTGTLVPVGDTNRLQDAQFNQ